MLLLFRGEEFDANFYHHSGVDIDHSFLIEDKGKKTLFVHKMNAALAKASFKGRVVVYSDPFPELSKFLKGKTAFYDSYSMSAHMAERIRKICRLKDHSEELSKARIVKSPEEISHISKAAKATREIMESLDFKSAKTELDIKKQLLLATFERGLETAFDPIVATDRNTSYPHYRGGKKRLGSLVLVDYGVKSGHYCSDITRCFILDGDRERKARYERLQDICWFIADSLPNMKKGKEVASLANDLMSKAGFPKLIHSIGHGVGLEVHESPSLGLKSEDALAGATMAIEPAFYLSNYGMRYEETVHNNGKKAKIL